MAAQIGRRSGSHAAKSGAGHGGRKVKSSRSAAIELTAKADWGTPPYWSTRTPTPTCWSWRLPDAEHGENAIDRRSRPAVCRVSWRSGHDGQAETLCRRSLAGQFPEVVEERRNMWTFGSGPGARGRRWIGI